MLWNLRTGMSHGYSLQEELVDRYGKLPEPGKALIETHRLRLLANKLGVRQRSLMFALVTHALNGEGAEKHMSKKVIGAAYTSVSFVTVFKKDMTERARNIATVIFIAVSLFFYIIITTPPAQMLVFVGGLNGLILPIGLSIFIYAGWARSDLMGGYRYPRWLLILGALTCALTWYMGYKSIGPIFALLTAA